ncbi:MAG: hypothetical protein ACRBFS_12835 [Aureispira sp.]
MKALYQILCYCCLGGLLTNAVALQAQVSDSSARTYPAINENLFVNTKWKYTYTTHAESNTVIHKADEQYDHFIFFRYDYGFQNYLNGTLTTGLWRLNKEENEINYPFRKVDWWRIAAFDEQSLILEFTMNRKSSYRYHFVQVSSQDAPFERSPNDLPDVLVDFDDPVEQATSESYLAYLEERGIRYNQKRWERRQAKRVNREERRRARLAKTARGRAKLAEEAPKELLQVELVGGGFFGGVDPVYRNIILIKSDGQVIKEYQSALQGLQVSKHTIERQTLEDLVGFIEEKKFFDFDQTYGCEGAACEKRLQGKPRPIALRLAVTKGVRRKIITIPIWDGRGKQHSFINYPDELDAIVRAIMNVATPPTQ